MNEWLHLDEWQKLPQAPGVYVIRHRETLKEYVGQSKDVRKRIGSHRKAVSSHYLGRALRLHGLAAFDVCLLTHGELADLGRLEQEAIVARGCRAPAGYNLADGGLGPTGVTWSEERRRAQSVARSGIIPSEETREKMRQARLKNNPFKGQKHSPETRVKMAAASKLQVGRVVSDETRAKLSASLKGRKTHAWTAESRAKISASKKGTKAPWAVKIGVDNPMHGKGSDHPSAKRVGVWFPEGLLPHAVFGSATEAAAWAGVKVCSIADWCRGRYRPKNGGFWTYL